MAITIPVLYVFSGLPGTGKTTLARMLAQGAGAAYLRIDTIEQGLRDLCSFNVTGEGYRLAYRIAADNLSLGFSVVADSCNPISLTRNEWEDIAKLTKSKIVNIEIICSCETEHKSRVLERNSDIAHLELPDWEAIKERHYDLWSTPRIIIDTAHKAPEESIQELTRAIEQEERMT